MKDIFKKGVKFAISRLLNKPFPFSVVVSLTSRCNFRCAYCNQYKRKVNDPPKEKVFYLLRKLKEYGAWRVIFIGGEPLIRKDISDILYESKKLGLKVGLISNGFFVPKFIDLIKETVSYVSLSIDGPKEITDKNRVPGAYDSVIKASEVLVKNGVKIKYNTVLTRVSATVDNVKFVINLAKKHNSHCSFGIAVSIPRIFEDVTVLNAEKKRYEEVINYLIDNYDSKIMTDVRSAMKVVRDWPDYTKVKINKEEAKKELKSYTKCYAGKYHFYVDTDGLLYPCCVFVGRYPAKNVYEVSFEEAWENAFNFNCTACMLQEMNTFNHVLGFKPSAIYDILRGNFFMDI